MANFLATIILLAISFFVIGIFPVGQKFFANIVDEFNEKKTNVTEEYERVKDEVEEIKDTAVETKEKVEETVETANKAVKTINEVLEKIRSLLGGDDEEEVTEEETPVEDSGEVSEEAESDSETQ